MKQKTTDKKVYEILCSIFDEWHCFATQYDANIGLTEILGDYRFIDDLDKNTTTRNDWFEIYEAMSGYFPDASEPFSKYVEADGGLRNVNIKVDGFKCFFPISFLPHYIVVFKRLSHSKKHAIPEPSPLLESVREAHEQAAGKDIDLFMQRVLAITA